MNNYKRQKQQAYERLKFLEKKLKLNSIMSEGFLQGNIYYCVHSFDLGVSMILKVAGNDEIAAIVSEFERKSLAKVYLCIEMAGTLTMLYVGPKEDEWQMPAIHNGTAIACAAVYNMEYKFMEIGDVVLMGLPGAPIR